MRIYRGMTQLSMLGNVLMSDILKELNMKHKASYRPDEKDEYEVHRYHDGDILLGVFFKGKEDKESRERILSKCVYFGKTKHGRYLVHFFDGKVLGGLVDYRSTNILLDCYVRRTEIIDDLKEVEK